MTESGSDRWPELLRLHRHDLLNGLQLVSGYLQLNKPERALQSVDRMARWLRTISWIQAVADSAAVDGWFKASHIAPHVLLHERPHDVAYTSELDDALSHAWRWLEEMAALYGISEMRLTVVGKTNKGQSGIEMMVETGEEEPSWWSSRPDLVLIQWTWNR